MGDKPDITGINRNSDGTFANGVSGNPKGRPKGSSSIRDILRRVGTEEIPETNESKLEVIMRSVFQQAVEGKSWAVQFIADRLEGKAVERSADISDEWKELVTALNEAE